MHRLLSALTLSFVAFPALAIVWMIQQTGGFPGKGAEAQGAFKKWAATRFSK